MNNLRSFSTRVLSKTKWENPKKASPSSNSEALEFPCSSELVEKAMKPAIFTTQRDLTRYLKKHVLAHAPGRFVVVRKPYGVSCVGVPLENGGVFENSVHDKKKTEKWISSVKERRSHTDEVTVAGSLNKLGDLLKEPELTFCTGLKRYISGAIVLPCNDKDLNILKNCIREMTTDNEPPYMYNSLAITVGRPEKRSGFIEGFATFRNLGKHVEYIFEQRKVTKRAKSGKYAVSGWMQYQVLDHQNGLSLVEFSTNKFARHLPRLMLTQLGSPIFGDQIYWRRIANVDDHPTLVTAGSRGHKIYIPDQLSKVMNVELTKPLLNHFPMYCHVYKTIFDSVGGHEEHGLVASDKPQTYFLSMLELSGLLPAYQNFMRKTETDVPVDTDLTDPLIRNSGETKF